MSPRFSKNGKRLGRPPKNKEQPAVFAINAPVATPLVQPVMQTDEADEPVVIDANSMVECEFVPVPQHVIVSYQNAEKKHGYYSGSVYAIEGINWCKWVVMAYLKADFEKYRKEGLKDIEILKRCINYLNAVPPKKKYAKKDPTPKYGKLELFKEDIQFTKKFGYECAILVCTTNQRKCEHFWGEGEKSL
jgi:hypothetical protein